MKIVTGYTGETHISSNDDQGRNQGIFGTGSYVLNVGNKFEATLVDANTVQIQDGEGVIQGVHFRVLPGTVDSVSIENGTNGYNRIDLIVARYTKDAVTGVENVNWAVITGTPTASTPTSPEYTEGDVLAGDTFAELPMLKVTLTGLTPVITPMFDECKIMHYKGQVGGDHGVSGSLTSSSRTVTGTSFTLEGGRLYFVDVACSIGGNTEQSTNQELVEFAIKYSGGSKAFSQKFYGPSAIGQTRGTFILTPSEDITLQASATTTLSLYAGLPVAMNAYVYAIA